MQLSHKHKPHNKVDYFKLPNGCADVFLHKNEKIETDEDGEVYVAEEVYFQTKNTVTKEMIEENLEEYWANKSKKPITEPGIEERLRMAEETILFLLMGGV